MPKDRRGGAEVGAKQRVAAPAGAGLRAEDPGAARADAVRRGGSSVAGRLAALVLRHPVAAVVLVALAARVFVAIAIWGLLPSQPPDALFYIDLASQKASGASAQWAPVSGEHYRENSVFLVPLTLLMWVFGPNVLMAQLFVAVLGAATAGLVTAFSLMVMSRHLALLAGAIVALLPSQVYWSAMTLKEATVWLLLVGMTIAVAMVARGDGRRLVWAVTLLVVLAVSLGFIRNQTQIVACWSLPIVVAVAELRHSRMKLFLGALAIAVIAPWIPGWGPGGVNFIFGFGDLADLRGANAENAETAFVAPRDTSGIPDPFSAGGEAGEEGEEGEEEVRAASLEHLPRGVSVMLFEPYPWQRTPTPAVKFAQLENVVWYPVLLLGFVGLVRLRRREPALLFAALFAATITGAYALAFGNFGTAYRHRAEIVWAVAIFAAIGARQAWDMIQRRRGGGVAAA